MNLTILEFKEIAGAAKEAGASWLNLTILEFKDVYGDFGVSGSKKIESNHIGI